MSRLFRLADNRRPDSLANTLRRRRMRIFWTLIETLPHPVRVLDLGGTVGFWKQMGGLGRGGLEIVLVNLNPETTSAANIEALTGDARDLSQLDDDSFEVVFSNSVIEHLSTWEDQLAMAAEIQRVGCRYFIQTPNRHFPIEPHFLVPGFQFLPVEARIALVRRLALGYHDRLPDPADARRAVEEIRLLSAAELRRLFPGANIDRERILGLTKSLIALGGWSKP